MAVGLVIGTVAGVGLGAVGVGEGTGMDAGVCIDEGVAPGAGGAGVAGDPTQLAIITIATRRPSTRSGILGCLTVIHLLSIRKILLCTDCSLPLCIVSNNNS